MHPGTKGAVQRTRTGLEPAQAQVAGIIRYALNGKLAGGKVVPDTAGPRESQLGEGVWVTVRHAIVVLLAIVALGGQPSAQAQQESLVGHWRIVDQSYDLTIEFKANGSYVALTAMGVMTGRWETSEGNYVSTWASDNRPRQVSHFRFEDGRLIITDATGQELVHERIELGSTQ